MPYPLPTATERDDGRLRLLPPLGCPGGEEWVLPQAVGRWLEIGFRLGPVPAAMLELWWMPSARRWNEELSTAAIELSVDPRGVPMQDLQVDWGDGTAELVPWTIGRPDVPKLRHVYAERSDLLVTVTMGLYVASLQVALLGCPLPPAVVIGLMGQGTGQGGGGGGLAGAQALVPGDGLDGRPYNGSATELWRLRLHPEGGLGLLPSPVDGKPALTVMYGSGAASRGTRWYSADGPPTQQWMEVIQPPPALGDFYLDRVTGLVFELVA
ncbi:MULTISPECIES: hypothetical protein [unclassified Synechococcus]|nr:MULTISPECIES: hypothetical protein [unclassified Synechococcus]APD47081.1 hypothetical protein BM449_00505 [Synechococcus sp. SynAce01]MCT4365686.1 hypothetical protein [Candidatus Regnicoccus frigidus MAG-AL1]MCT4366765.1 hypothetical protein [Candidatus Regnicoccus frigidus MAG-AL2]TWB89076.1 hypothetical protein FB106_11484 [Synechococcus sp. Ace-Pa]